jgi:hypothetical protein
MHPGLVLAVHSLSKGDSPDGDDSSDLESTFEDLVKAIKSDDSASGAQALKKFFTICDAGPHAEGSHEDEESEEG